MSGIQMSEEIMAFRITEEMESRRWSQARMAAEMTAVGCPMHQSAISKIIKPRGGARRRNITVDEAIGFAKVFGTTVMDLARETPASTNPYEAGWQDGYERASAAVAAALAANKPERDQ